MRIIGFTGSRADYYLQQPIFHQLLSNEDVDLQIIVSGSIPSEKDQVTLNDIRADGIPIIDTIPLNADISSNNHSLQISYLLNVITHLLHGMEIDAVLVYADRFESYAFALAAFHLDLVIVHLEAGDITEGGTYDDSIRHSLTKLSHLQATSTLKGLNNVRCMGEEPWRNVSVGLLSYESLQNIPLAESKNVAHSLGLSSDFPLILGTMHPIPMDPILTRNETEDFLLGLELASSKHLFDTILTAPNHDSGNEIIRDLIDHFLPKIRNCKFVESLGGYRYQCLLSLARAKTVIVCGNSSSVIKEAPYYSAHGLNVGRRQQGREAANSQVNVPADRSLIDYEIGRLLYEKCEVTSNPYLGVKPAESVVHFIMDILTTKSREELLLKKWHYTTSA
jgi:UDP-hydrolysing UDP-N-acetyl-D-glucosamine 2-epimerase